MLIEFKFLCLEYQADRKADDDLQVLRLCYDDLTLFLHLQYQMLVVNDTSYVQGLICNKMGSQAPSNARRSISRPTRNRNGFSLDESLMKAQLSQRGNPPSEPKPPSVHQNSFEQSSIVLPPATSVPSLPKKDAGKSSQHMTKRSISLAESLRPPKSPLPPDKTDSKLNKLNTKNDELRQQLISISSQLTSKLSRKKYKHLKKDKQQDKSNDEEESPKEKKSIPALKRELQNGYKQIDRYKKLISDLKGNESLDNEQRANFLDSKVQEMDHLIEETQNEIEAAKNINQNQQIMIRKAEQEYKNSELRVQETEIERLKAAIKKFAANDRKRQHKQRMTQEYMFQLQRKHRQMNGEYLPEIKSYANKNFQPQPVNPKKKKDEYGLHKPAGWEIADAADQLRTIKEKHEEYHVKMERALKEKQKAREASDKVKEDLQTSEKLLENLHYKKDRYLQLVMGNMEYLMKSEEEEPPQAEGEVGQVRTITRGNDQPDQVHFDDHELLKRASPTQIKIVSVNVWFNGKRQICAFQSIYSDGREFFMGCRTSSINGDMEKEVLEVEEGDYIKNIMGSFSKKGAVQFLAFYSVRGKARQFGKEMMNGLNFTLNVTKQERPICFAGYSFFDGTSWRVNKLMVDVAVAGAG